MSGKKQNDQTDLVFFGHLKKRSSGQQMTEKNSDKRLTEATEARSVNVASQRSGQRNFVTSKAHERRHNLNALRKTTPHRAARTTRGYLLFCESPARNPPDRRKHGAR